MSKQKKFILQESEIPTQWYNIQADMVNKPMPPLNPATHQPLKAEDLFPIFAEECSRQELDQTNAWIDIPEEVQDKYRFYRSTPLVRAYELEKALDTPAHIYFKNESTNPLGSHKVNSALPQCYYCKQQGVTNVTTETGAGQWGAALSYAARVFEDNTSAETLPRYHDAYIRRDGRRLSFDVHTSRKEHHHSRPDAFRLAWNRNQRGYRAGNEHAKL